MEDFEKYLSGWEIEGLIGQGAYGKVYRIKKEELGYAYYSALKVIKIPSDEKEAYSINSMGMDNDSLRAYYEGTAREISNEIRIMESLKSANNIVHVEEHSLIPNEDRLGWTILIRMELLESIRNYQLRVGPPNLYEVVKIGKDLCAALECCEEKKIVHRDVKPDNVFRNEFGTYKLGDFGIARKLENTKAGYSQKGTMNYIAPEVVKGNVYDNSVDIYSLGLMLYIYLNRQVPPFVDVNNRPISASALQEAQWRRINGEMLPVPVDAPVSLANIILTACHPSPSYRYRRAADFRKALEDWERKNTGGQSKSDTVVLDSAVINDNRAGTRRLGVTQPMEEDNNLQPVENNKRKYTLILIALIAILGLTLAGGAFYMGGQSRKKQKKSATSNDIPKNQTVNDNENVNKSEANQSEADNVKIVDKYIGLDYEQGKSQMKDSIVYRVSSVFTDRKIDPDRIVSQYPSAGSQIQPDKEGVTLYVGRGRLENDWGYKLQSDAFELQLKKREKTTVTLTLVGQPDISGSINYEYQDGLNITFREWEGDSVKADIVCEDDFFKGGMIQFYFREEENENSGAYCNIYYTVK